jgi:hypothetical protein
MSLLERNSLIDETPRVVVIEQDSLGDNPLGKPNLMELDAPEHDDEEGDYGVEDEYTEDGEN